MAGRTRERVHLENLHDTRYSFAALAAGLVVLVIAAGAMSTAVALPVAIGAGVVAGAFVASSIKYTDQWGKAVLLRLGRYRGLCGPGYFAIVPIIDRVTYHIDQRIRTTAFGAESCLTRDTVPVNVDAIAIWVVRDAIGKHDLAELIQSRVELGHGLKGGLEQKRLTWGIQVPSVDIRDVIIPAALEDAMSRQAQTERERQALAMNLRAMHMLDESIVKRGSLMVVPSGLADSLNLPALMGMVGASGHVPEAAVTMAAGHDALVVPPVVSGAPAVPAAWGGGS